MGRYRPGTLDPWKGAGDRLRREARKRREANAPGRTQTYQTTSKVESVDAKVSEQDSKIADALDMARQALDMAEDIPVECSTEDVEALFTATNKLARARANKLKAR